MLPLRNDAQRHHDSSGVSTLVRAAEHFAMLDRPTSEEIFRFKELFYALSLKSSASERLRIANTLARGNYTPRSIALFYAMDDVSIASSTLLFSPVLNERDLVAIIQKCGFLHAEFIACRNNIDAGVIREILKIDDENRTLFAALKENLSLSGKTVQALSQEQQEIDNKPLPSANPLAFAGEVIADPLKAKDANDQLVKLAGKGGKLGQMPKLTKLQEAKIAERAGLGKVLLTHARNKNYEAFAFEIKKTIGLPIETSRTILQQRDTGKTATILKALNIKQLECMKILLLLNPVLGEDVVRFRKVTRQFEMLEQQKCIDYLRTIGADAEPTNTRPDPSQALQRRRIALQSGQQPTKHTPQNSTAPLDSDVLLKMAG